MPASQSAPSATSDAFVERKNCPACGGREYLVQGRPARGFAAAVGDWTLHQPDYEARRCAACQLVYKSHVAAPGMLSRYYAEVDFNRWESDRLHPSEELILRELARLPRSARILDFGCSTGRLLARLARTHACHGFEINGEAAEQAAGKGIMMLSPEQLSACGPQDGFDAVTVVDVFEHLDNPWQTLESLASSIRPGGMLLICTGDSDAGAVRGEPATYWYFRLVEHLCMLNEAHSRMLAARMGMEVEGLWRCRHFRVPPQERWRQSLRSLMYSVFHQGRWRFVRPLAGAAPGLRRAKAWTDRPWHWCARDHLVICLRKAAPGP